MKQPEPKQTDVSVVDNILNAVLSLMPEPDILYVPDFIRFKGISEAVRGFNPETHVIVAKEQLDITKQIQALSGMVNQFEQVVTVQAVIAKQVNELHAVQTGNIKQLNLETKKPLNPKQQKKLEDELKMQDMFNRANSKSINRITNP